MGLKLDRNEKSLCFFNERNKGSTVNTMHARGIKGVVY